MGYFLNIFPALVTLGQFCLALNNRASRRIRICGLLDLFGVELVCLQRFALKVVDTKKAIGVSYSTEEVSLVEPAYRTD